MAQLAVTSFRVDGRMLYVVAELPCSPHATKEEAIRAGAMESKSGNAWVDFGTPGVGTTKITLSAFFDRDPNKLSTLPNGEGNGARKQDAAGILSAVASGIMAETPKARETVLAALRVVGADWLDGTLRLPEKANGRLVADLKAAAAFLRATEPQDVEPQDVEPQDVEPFEVDPVQAALCEPEPEA